MSTTSDETTSAPANTFEDDEAVTVLHGYGRVAPDKSNGIDGFEFKGGVCRGVPYRVANTWKKKGMRVHILKLDSDEADYARITGIVPMEPERLAIMLMASDMEKVFHALGPERALHIVQELGRLLGADLAEPATRRARAK